MKLKNSRKRTTNRNKNKKRKNKKSQCGPLPRNINQLHTWEESENKVM